jgi:hypothetical protein
MLEKICATATSIEIVLPLRHGEKKYGQTYKCIEYKICVCKIT